MKALIKQKAERGIWLTETQKPTIGNNDVLVKIKKTAICGTDIHIYNWDEWAKQTIKTPLVIGHEFVGTIVEKGHDVKGVEINDRVSGEGHIACEVCRNCRAGKRHVCRINQSIGVTVPGAFAEYLKIPAQNVYKIPDEISDNVAACLDPFGNAAHTALSFNLIGEDVLITGAGPIGIMAATIAKHAGARNVVITDVNQYRLDLAKQMGATYALNVKNANLDHVIKELGMTEGFDVCLEMSGNPEAFNDMLKYSKHAAKISLLGFLPNSTQIDWNKVIMKGLTLKGIYGREMFETWYKMVSMLQSGLDITPLITNEFAIDDYQKAFDTMLSGKSGKVILNWE